ncbi:MAG: hypothetical protein GF313_07120, partial [Caldithrix sp.]|nr:hypothetical protein [Caldithrix sp.]
MRNYLITLTAFLTIAACTLNEPHLPSWDTKWTFFLPVQDYELSEIIKEDSLLTADTTANGIPIISINSSDSTDWERIASNDMTIDPDDDRFVEKVGEISLGDPEEIKSPELNLDELLPPVLLNSGDTLPPYDPLTAHPEVKNVEFERYKSVHVKKGLLWLTFYNETFLKIRSGMTIKVYNDGPSLELIDELVFTESIDPSETVKSTTIDLANQTLSNQFVLEYSIPIAGSDTSKVLTEEDKSGSTYSILHLDTLTVDQAQAKIPSQSFDRSKQIDLQNQKHQLKHAVIDRGSITFIVDNHLPIDSDIKLTLYNFLENGSYKTINLRLMGDENRVKTIDLSDMEIINYKDPDAIIDSLGFNVEATVDSTTDYVTINADDSVAVDIQIDSLYFESITGILDRI